MGEARDRAEALVKSWRAEAFSLRREAADRVLRAEQLEACAIALSVDLKHSDWATAEERDDG